MTKDRIYAWARQLQGMVKRARELEASLDDGEAYRQLLVDAEPAKALEVAKSIADGRKKLAEFGASIARVSRRTSLGDAEELITDLTHALQAAEERYDQWRQRKVHFELCVAEGVAADTRAVLEGELGAAKAGYESVVDYASSLVPSLGVVQL